MAVYYKFKSAKFFDSIPIVGHFISLANLKEQIFESKHLGKGKDYDLIITHAQTNEEYHGNAEIPKKTSVLVRRIPGVPCKTIVVEREERAKAEENKLENAQPENSNFTAVDSSILRYPREAEWDEFVNELYDEQKVLPVQSSVPLLDASLRIKDDEDSKIKALIDTPALDWQRESQEGLGAVRGFGRLMGGKSMGGRGFGQGGLAWKIPPEGYICHRCKVPGHYIQYCPTNSDASYDVRRMKPPTGIPKSMLMATRDGSYALPSGAVAILKPNEAAFEKEMEGLPCTRKVIDIPSELHCPLCKEVMKEAVLTKKCCFNSFCHKCIRGYIISKSMCFCGATNILADDLVPNMTVREAINSILESNSSSTTNTSSSLKIQGTELARSSLPKAPSSTLSATSKSEKISSSHKDHSPDDKDPLNDGIPVNAPQQSFEKGQTSKTADRFESTHESPSPKEQGSAPPVQAKVEQKLPAREPGKKWKMKKTHLPVNDLHWGTSQNIAAENYMMPFAPSAYNPYWGGVQLGMNGYMAPFSGAMPYTGDYAPGPFDNPLGRTLPQVPFGGQGYLLPGVPYPRDSSAFDMGLDQVRPPVMRKDESEARKADLKRKRDQEYYEDEEFGRAAVSRSGDASSSMESKHVHRRITSKHHHLSHSTGNVDHHQHHHQGRSEKVDHHPQARSFSGSRRSRVAPILYDEELSSDDERNFKRTRSWYESSSGVTNIVKAEEESFRSRHYERSRTWAREQIVLG